MMTKVEQIAGLLRAAREAQGISQVELVRRMGLKGQSRISKLENAVEAPGLEALIAWADALGFDVHLVFNHRTNPSLGTNVAVKGKD